MVSPTTKAAPAQASGSIFGFDHSADPFSASSTSTTGKLTAPSSDGFGGPDPFGSFGDDFQGITPTGASTPIKPLPAAAAKVAHVTPSKAQGDVGNLLDF